MGIGLAASAWFSGVSAQGNSIFDSEDDLWVVGDVRVPAVADTFALFKVDRYPVLSLGVGLTYITPLVRNLDLSIFVYPARGEPEAAIRSEFDQAVQEIHEHAARRLSDWSVTVEREESFTLETEGGARLEGRVAEVDYFRSGQTRRSLLYVFEKSGLILKYRITHDAGAAPELDGHLAAWMRITAEHIEPYEG